MTIFSRALPLEISHRIWDCFMMEGEIFLYRAAVGTLNISILPLGENNTNDSKKKGMLKLDQQQLEVGTFDECVALVKNFKDIDGNRLFRKIFSVPIPKYLIVMTNRLKHVNNL